MPSATYSGTWTQFSDRTGNKSVYKKVASRLYKRSASRAAGRDNVHNAIANYFGNEEDGHRRGSGGGGSGSRSRSGYYGYDAQSRRPNSKSRWGIRVFTVTIGISVRW